MTSAIEDQVLIDRLRNAARDCAAYHFTQQMPRVVSDLLEEIDLLAREAADRIAEARRQLLEDHR